MLSTLAVRLTSVGVPPNSLLAPDRSCILNGAVAASQLGNMALGSCYIASMALGVLWQQWGQLGQRQPLEGTRRHRLLWQNRSGWCRAFLHGLNEHWLSAIAQLEVQRGCTGSAGELCLFAPMHTSSHADVGLWGMTYIPEVRGMSF